MQYSLLTRFQGALLGAALGEELDQYGTVLRSQPLSASEQQLASVATRLYHWRPGLAAQTVPTIGATTRWGKVAVHTARALIDQANGQNAVLQTGLGIPAASEGWDPAMHAEQLGIACLPIMLFYHEDPGKLRQQLSLAVAPATYWGVLAVGTAIARALRERLEPALLLAKVVNFLSHQEGEVSAVAIDLITRLEQVEQALEQRASLDVVLASLGKPMVDPWGHAAIALAFYCFLSTPQDFHLSLSRAAQAGSGACALTGALSGAYNSLSGMPLSWQIASAHSSYTLPWGIAPVSLQKLANELLAAWSGAYDTVVFSGKATAIGAPGVMRPR